MSSEVYIVNLVDRRRPSLSRSMSVHLSRAKLITRSYDRYAVAKFSKSRIRSKVPEGSTLIFEGTVSKEAPVLKTSPIRSAVSIQRLVTDTEGHGAIASTRAITSSCG